METTSDSTEYSSDTENLANGVSDGPSERAEVAAKRVLLASVGAFAAACDTAAQTFDQFVDRGQRVRNEWESKADEVRDQNRDATIRARHYMRNAIDAFLETIHIPSKTDVDAIQLKLNVLNRKLDDLQMQSSREPFVPPEPPISPVSNEDAIT